MFIVKTKNSLRNKPVILMTVVAIFGSFLIQSALIAQTETNEPQSITPDIRAGAQIYNAVCKGCHSVSIAPTLRGVIDRPIASIESFAGYSDGLKSKNPMIWSKENLSAFLSSPTEFAPGTLMIQVIPEAQKRADIIGFLESLPPPR